ncbi:3-hydroxyacyl-CoA dehydrogenase/enoyl-CoA hydratase family protein [Rubrobacter taiwanensis]|jgi:3-hydroxyacyl-CoA dehydrogenase|uniref:3-hydroxyacyl-CoA dehydrogenase/enoyl-CoA hydratase family protein n=1 Tax=Rubrobacter taiwanensis TaxID=185139 RepID=A0A4V2NVU5_9ACTN|nr:3-hydroxyacyl-CoA dehydrogenase/enoyl-CoA hydratase family protein [Rubrobacter taiwanensis]TCJ14812.1 3-hydroxyacyl-CoA dehydrogenase/enoyl-CoA hydratase family protein [Rubrobacter taiwanensis]
MSEKIRKVAVLGAGTMGAAIAAHCANAGLEVELLDIAGEGEDKDEIVRAGFQRMLKARPAALMKKELAGKIRLGNFEEDFERVSGADWVVEAIIEKLEPKRELMERVEQVAKEDAIISSNTSGIPLSSIAEGRSESFRRRFLGTHFFNPPRYLKLLELIPTADTDPEVLERMRRFGERTLGKGTVLAKDTPNFIGNRLGSFAGMQAVRYAFDNGYSIEEVDAITGPLIGHPKTATFRLNDTVGLDIAVGVAENLYELVPEDESREELKPHPILKRMIEKNLLGNKTGAGFYKRTRRDGKTVFDVLDLKTFEHRPAEKPEIPLVKEANRRKDLGERLRFIIDKAGEDRHARYIRDTLLPYIAYAARRVPEISDSFADVDHAMEWGFAHQAGPFRTWDMIGFEYGIEQMQKLDLELPDWVSEMRQKGIDSFYKRDEEGRELVYDLKAADYVPVRVDPEIVSLERIKAADKDSVVASNDSASLVDLGDGVLAFEIHSRASAIDSGVVEMGFRALEELRNDRWAGLVIANEADNFCVGANLFEVMMGVQMGAFDQIRERVAQLQELLMGFRFADKPVVAAPHGQTLGGGVEICLHADRIVAAGETYMGLVEVGVGVIPAGGGTKEMARRLVSPPLAESPLAPPLPFVQKAFENIALARVGTSALESRDLGYLDEDDRVVMSVDHQLAVAKREVIDLADGYRPPDRSEKSVYAAGAAIKAAMIIGVRQMQWGHFATEYDGVIAERLAHVLCGGDLSAGQWVTEDYILGLEREAFVELLQNEKTQERIRAMLETGKPLRN